MAHQMERSDQPPIAHDRSLMIRLAREIYLKWKRKGLEARTDCVTLCRCKCRTQESLGRILSGSNKMDTYTESIPVVQFTS